MQLLKLISIIAMFLLVLPVVFPALAEQRENLVIRYSCDNSDISGATVVDATGRHDGTLIGGSSGGATAKVGDAACDFDGASGYIQVDLADTGDVNHTICTWWNPDTLGTYHFMAYNKDCNDAQGNYCYRISTNNNVYIDFNVGSGGFPAIDFAHSWNVGEYQSMCWVFTQNGTTLWSQFYLNETLVATQSTGGGDDRTVWEIQDIGGQTVNNRFSNSQMDEWCAWNSSLTPAEIGEYVTEFATQNCTGIPIAPDTTPPSVTVNPPANNTAFNQLFINFTVSVTDDTASILICELRNETELLDSDLISVSTPTNLTYLSGLAEIQQANMYKITCFDNTVPNNNSAAVLLNITLDNIFPTITVTSPANNSIIDKTFNNLTIDALCSDRKAIAFNVSIIDSSGNILSSIQNNTDGSEILIKNVTDISNFPTGNNFNINFTCVDGHTYSDSKVTYFTKDKALSKVYYDTLSGNDVSIQMYSSTLPLCDFGSRSAPDREIFWYDFKSCNPDAKGIQTYKYTLRDNDNELKYLKDSDYESHFVTKDNFITFQIDKTAGYAIRKIGKDYDVVLTTVEKFLDFRHSIGGLNEFQLFLNFSVIETNFTSIEHFDLMIPDIILDSATFVTVSDIAFNLSQDRKLTMFNSLVLKKFSNPQSTEVTGRIIFNNIVLLERSVSSVAGLDTARSINFIIDSIDGAAGTNNLTYEVKEDDIGSINISNWMTQIITNVTSRQKEYGITSQLISAAFNSNDFTNISSMVVNKAVKSKTLLDISNRFEDVLSTVTCILDGNISSPIYRRTILSEADVASTGMSFIDEQETNTKNYSVNCSNTGATTILSNATFIALDLRDLSSNIINANHSSNAASGISGSTLIFSSGNHEITSINNFIVRDGNDATVTSTVHLNSSTGSQVPIITLNSSNNCFDRHERSLVADEIGTVKFYSSCNISGVSTINFTLGIMVEAGETVTIVDESLTVFEVSSLNTSVANTAPLVSITAPDADAILFDLARIDFFVSELNNNKFAVNITAINVSDASDITLIATNLGDTIKNVTFNFTPLGEGDFTLRVLASENETPELLQGEASRLFTVRFPSISVNLTSPLNNSVDIDGLVVFQFITDTGNSNNCSLFIDNTINFINQSINATVGLNTFAPVRLNNATHTWLVRCNNGTLTGVSSQFILNVLIPDPNALSITICPSTAAGMFKLSLVIGIAIIFIGMGFAFNVGIVGVFGAVMLMISSWSISPCSNVYGFAVALLSGVLIILFILRGLVKREQ